MSALPILTFARKRERERDTEIKRNEDTEKEKQRKRKRNIERELEAQRKKRKIFLGYWREKRTNGTIKTTGMCLSDLQQKLT